jgi:hypothetical protein
MSHRKSDLGIPPPQESAKVVLAHGRGRKNPLALTMCCCSSSASRDAAMSRLALILGLRGKCACRHKPHRRPFRFALFAANSTTVENLTEHRFLAFAANITKVTNLTEGRLALFAANGTPVPNLTERRFRDYWARPWRDMEWPSPQMCPAVPRFKTRITSLNKELVTSSLRRFPGSKHEFLVGTRG